MLDDQDGDLKVDPSCLMRTHGVGRVKAVDGPLAGPFSRDEQHTDERAALILSGGRVDGVRSSFEPGVKRRVNLAFTARIDRDRALNRAAHAGARLGV